MSYSIKFIENNELTARTEAAFSNLFEYSFRPIALAEAVRNEQMSFRTGQAHTKTRAEVSGGGRKPWKQKGTGRARHGSIRSPLWVGGGVTFGPRNTVNWNRKTNKTAKVAALKTILKDRLEDNIVFQFNSDFDYPKTKVANELLEQIISNKSHRKGKVAFFYTTDEKSKFNGFSNLDVNLINAGNLKLSTLVNSSAFVLTPAARLVLEEKIK